MDNERRKKAKALEEESSRRHERFSEGFTKDAGESEGFSEGKRKGEGISESRSFSEGRGEGFSK
jgi:hypothetical protein